VSTLRIFLAFVALVSGASAQTNPIELKTNDGASSPQVRMYLTGGAATSDVVFERCRVRFDAASAAYLNLSGADSAAGDIWYSGGAVLYDDGASRTIVTRDGTAVTIPTTTGTTEVWFFDGVVTTSGIAGTFAFRWAQSTYSGNSTTVEAGSYLWVQEK